MVIRVNTFLRKDTIRWGFFSSDTKIIVGFHLNLSTRALQPKAHSHWIKTTAKAISSEFVIRLVPRNYSVCGSNWVTTKDQSKRSFSVFVFALTVNSALALCVPEGWSSALGWAISPAPHGRVLCLTSLPPRPRSRLLRTAPQTYLLIFREHTATKSAL